VSEANENKAEAHSEARTVERVGAFTLFAVVVPAVDSGAFTLFAVVVSAVLGGALRLFAVAVSIGSLPLRRTGTRSPPSDPPRTSDRGETVG